MVWSRLLTNLTINNRIPFILINCLLCTTISLSWIILEFRNMEKSLGALTFRHSVFTMSKIFNKVFTKLYFGISCTLVL